MTVKDNHAVGIVSDSWIDHFRRIGRSYSRLRLDIGGGHALSFSNRLGVVHGVSRLRHHRSRTILTGKHHVDSFHSTHSWNSRPAFMALGRSHDLGDEPRRQDRWISSAGIESIFQKTGGRADRQGANLEGICAVHAPLQRVHVHHRLCDSFVAAGSSSQSRTAKARLEPSLIFNTAASFTSNTNLQHYSGEVSLSYFSQIFGLMWLQFVSAATGIAALTALARGLAGKTHLGNFYRDLMRATFLVLLPLAVVVAVLLVFGGVPMTLAGCGHGQDARRRAANHRQGTGRGLRRHQATGHQRRRILRPQLRASVRESVTSSPTSLSV